MAMYSALRDAFNDLNRSISDQADWNERHAADVERRAGERRREEFAQQDQLLRRRSLELQAKKADYEQEEVGINILDLLDKNDNDGREWVRENELEVANSLGGYSFKKGPREQGGGVLIDATGNPVRAERFRLKPKLKGFMFQMGAQRDPIARQENELANIDNRLASSELELTNFKKKHGVIQPGMGAPWALQQELTKKRDGFKAASDDLSAKLDSKPYRVSLLKGKQRALDFALGGIIEQGVDPAVAQRIYAQASDSTTRKIARLEGDTVLERSHFEYQQEGGTLGIADYKNQIYDKGADGVTDFKFFVDQRRLEVKSKIRQNNPKITNKALEKAAEAAMPSMTTMRSDYLQKTPPKRNDLTPNVVLTQVGKQMDQLYNLKGYFEASPFGASDVASKINDIVQRSDGAIRYDDAFFEVMTRMNQIDNEIGSHEFRSKAGTKARKAEEKRFQTEMDKKVKSILSLKRPTPSTTPQATGAVPKTSTKAVPQAGRGASAVAPATKPPLKGKALGNAMKIAQKNHPHGGPDLPLVGRNQTLTWNGKRWVLKKKLPEFESHRRDNRR
jgi:hypothetical protein